MSVKYAFLYKILILDESKKCYNNKNTRIMNQLEVKVLGLENLKEMYNDDPEFSEPYIHCKDGKGWKNIIYMMDFSLELTNFVYQILRLDCLYYRSHMEEV